MALTVIKCMSARSRPNRLVAAEQLLAEQRTVFRWTDAAARDPWLGDTASCEMLTNDSFEHLQTCHGAIWSVKGLFPVRVVNILAN